ncbi:MAG: endonuclease [Bacteroidales bacterium]|nr:endonuclease [Bacteroidales bacterium]
MRVRNVLFLPLILALLSGCSGKRSRPSESEVYPKEKGVTRIVQYNVGAFSKEIENSIPMVSAMMKEIGADALSLNELDSCNTRHPSDQLKDFAEAMDGWNHRFGQAMPYLEGGYGVGVAVPDKILESFNIALPKGKGLEPRACRVVETKRYVLASTHLDYKDEPSIIAQAQLINDEITKRYSKGKKPVFLAGDMNSTPTSAVLKELEKEWEVISCRKNTFSAEIPHVCIDFILVLKNKAKYKVIGSEVPVDFKTGEVRTASDHLPVFADVKL